MAPVGSRESLAAALKAGADSIYFGIEALNMRAHSANRFTIDDLREIAAMCAEHGVKSYLTVNTIIYDEDIELMHRICDAAHDAGISAVIAADVVVLARELNLRQVAHIHQAIEEQNICGPSGAPVRIEMFCHGALCMAVSGKCYLSLDNLGRSANRGECMQVCRRSYTVRDRETGVELDVDNKYIMSPKDLKTIGFIDRMMKAGVRVFKIEGRARSAEYVYTVVRCYKEAIEAVERGEFTEEKVEDWNTRLKTVFNRGFWDGYYLGQRLGEWSAKYGSSATEKKVYVGKGTKYFSRLGVGEFYLEAGEIKRGDKLVVIGPTTGVIYLTADEIHYDNGPVEVGKKGWAVSVAVPEKIRPSDKLYKLVATDDF